MGICEVWHMTQSFTSWNAVLDYRNSDGGCRLATLCRDAFFRFGEAYGFTRPGETAAGFVRRVKRSGT
jgi:hypothetical protein